MTERRISRLMSILKSWNSRMRCESRQNSLPAGDIGGPDLRSLAEAIMSLDLILTIDTMVAHLAGALGVPVWTMLHAECDWRWPKTGRQSIWYPTMRLFHQPKPGDWESVVE